MNMIRYTLFAAFAAVCTLCHAAYPTLAWTAETSTSQAKAWPLRSGATARLEARLTSMGRALELAPATPCTLFWQTNGMAAAEWWATPAEVTTNGVASAVFTANLPAGARVLFFFRVGDKDALVYDATGTLNILPSPGPEPEALVLEPPPKVLDVAAVEVLNAPWLTAESDPVASMWQSTHLATRNPHGVTAADVGALAVNDSGAVEGIVVDGAIVMRQGVYHSFFELRDLDTLEVDVWAFPHQQDGVPGVHTFASMADVTSMVSTAISADALPLAGGTMTGALTLAADGIMWQGVNTATNYTVRAEWDGTNVSFNVYEVPR